MRSECHVNASMLWQRAFTRALYRLATNALPTSLAVPPLVLRISTVGRMARSAMLALQRSRPTFAELFPARRREPHVFAFYNVFNPDPAAPAFDS